MDANKDKYDLIIKDLIAKKVSIDVIIVQLNKNRLKFSDEESNNCTTKNNNVNSNFVSYFLKYLHDESNSYLVLRLQQQSNQINFEETKLTDTSKIINKNNNIEDSYNSSFHISPKTYSSLISPQTQHIGNIQNSPIEFNNNSNINQKQKRRTLPNQIHTWATTPNTSQTELKNSPSEFSNIIYNNKNKRKTLVLQPKNAWESSSTPKNLTPTYSTKLSSQKSRPTLFDFVSPPVQIQQTAQNKQNAIEDFKARFYQHQNKLEKIEAPSPKVVEPQKPKAPQKQITDFKKAVLEKLSSDEINKLTVIAEFYAQLLLNNFILTVNTELFFLFQLLTLSIVEEMPGQKETKDHRMFTSMESCIYFSMITLRNLECILKFLKSSTLQELKQNIYIKSFTNLFEQDSIILKHEINTEEIKSKHSSIFFESKQAPFYAENNFHDKTMSVISKNQRDAFYDIFWQWEKNHKLENWNFTESLGEKIRLLVSLKENMTHFLQFIKLFQEQLVLICKDDKMLIDNNDQNDGPEHLKSIYDPMKLKRLNARMMTPKPNYGPNPSPIFFGYQEFFKDFIDISASPIFHQYLKDNLSNEIETIHKEIPDMGVKDDSSFNKEMIEDMLLRLRILGKFLGYLYFCPYNHSMPNHFVKNLIEIRNNSIMPLNLQFYIERAIDNKHLILTVPFIVEFLSMMDEHAYLIDSIQQTISMLIIIYNSTSMLIKSNEFTIDKFLLLIYIAWLLQLKKIQYSKLKINQNLNIDQNKIGLDNFPIITPLLLNFCCPFLDELQKLMVKFTTGVKRYEHKIKDVSHLFAFELVNEYSALSKYDSNKKVDKHQIQMQLTSQFLFLHPNYKRLVEFAAETTIANYIKYFRLNIFKIKLNEEIKAEALKQTGKEYDQTETQAIILETAKRISKKLSKICIDQSLKFFKEKIENVIINSIDKNSTPLINTTNQIALYKTVQKLNQWIKTNLNEDIFYEEIKLKMCKKIMKPTSLLYRFQFNEKDNSTDESAMMQSNYLMLFEKFNYFKVILKNLMNIPSDTQEFEETIEETLKQIKKYLIDNKTENKLLKPFDIQLCNLIWEILLFYTSNDRDFKFLENVIDQFINIEIMINNRNEEAIITRLFCPRNIYFLQTIQNKECMIENLKEMLSKSIKNHQNFEKLCT